MIKNKKLERAIEIGVEKLKNSLYEKECEIRSKFIELKENELLLKQKESNLQESIRILEQEKKNNEYLKIVNTKTEKLFNSALESLKSKEKILNDGLNSIITEFNIENINNDLNIESKIDIIKNFIRKLRDDDNNILETLKKQQLELFNQNNINCKCSYSLINLNNNNNNNNNNNMHVDNNMHINNGINNNNNLNNNDLNNNNLNESKISELEFRFLELDWERRAIDHTKETLRLEKLKQEEIFISKEKELRKKSEELEIRLKEVKRMEEILKRRMNNINNNDIKNNLDNLNNIDNMNNVVNNNIHVNEIINNLNNSNNKMQNDYKDNNNSNLLSYSKITDISSSERNIYSNKNIIDSNLISNVDSNLQSNINNDNLSLITTPINDYKYLNYSNSDKLIPSRMSPLLRNQRQRLKSYLYDDDNIENYDVNEDIFESLSRKSDDNKRSQLIYLTPTNQ